MVEAVDIGVVPVLQGRGRGVGACQSTALDLSPKHNSSPRILLQDPVPLLCARHLPLTQAPPHPPHLSLGVWPSTFLQEDPSHGGLSCHLDH